MGAVPPSATAAAASLHGAQQQEGGAVARRPTAPCGASAGPSSGARGQARPKKRPNTRRTAEYCAVAEVGARGTASPIAEGPVLWPATCGTGSAPSTTFRRHLEPESRRSSTRGMAAKGKVVRWAGGALVWSGKRRLGARVVCCGEAARPEELRGGGPQRAAAGGAATDEEGPPGAHVPLLDVLSLALADLCHRFGAEQGGEDESEEGRLARSAAELAQRLARASSHLGTSASRSVLSPVPALLDFAAGISGAQRECKHLESLSQRGKDRGSVEKYVLAHAGEASADLEILKDAMGRGVPYSDRLYQFKVDREWAALIAAARARSSAVADWISRSIHAGAVARATVEAVHTFLLREAGAHDGGGGGGNGRQPASKRATPPPPSSMCFSAAAAAGAAELARACDDSVPAGPPGDGELYRDAHALLRRILAVGTDAAVAGRPGGEGRTGPVAAMAAAAARIATMLAEVAKLEAEPRIAELAARWEALSSAEDGGGGAAAGATIPVEGVGGPLEPG
eukprot:CAMPEP_0179269972 /NCGR_PEP_ID=MMETSP0797-20121207/31231_1 /TAXON_ID=47934 /ORGANISM="Dinophysis acuminata, Strain DAEP01" /LENGTH=512 /DNA_ID=CAMNT_0020978301 /DNA_START=1 /DNA_END=1537 /DNA_ORIENTATION=-